MLVGVGALEHERMVTRSSELHESIHRWQRLQNISILPLGRAIGSHQVSFAFARRGK